jgi:hypothetical protein
MKAHRLIKEAAFGPETVGAICQAFDQAWPEIARYFGDNPVEIEAARLRLAEAMLSVATESSTDVSALKTGALLAMALNYRIRPSVKNTN